MEVHQFFHGVCSKSTFLLLNNKPLKRQYQHLFPTLPTNNKKNTLMRIVHHRAAANTSPETNQDPASADPEPEPVVEIRFRRGTRRRARMEQEGGDAAAPIKPKAPAAPKDWDSMTLNEKVAELYLGEKGMLFWLNKFAYASIFIVIGGWILFRFVGPSLGLYQLDGSPLPPSDLLKGSSP